MTYCEGAKGKAKRRQKGKPEGYYKSVEGKMNNRGCAGAKRSEETKEQGNNKQWGAGPSKYTRVAMGLKCRRPPAIVRRSGSSGMLIHVSPINFSLSRSRSSSGAPQWHLRSYRRWHLQLREKGNSVLS